MTSVTFSIAAGGDGSTVSDDANPNTGLDNGGHRYRFVPALANVVSIGLRAVQAASDAQSAAAIASGFVGYGANTNTKIGYQVGGAITTGTNNTALGWQSLNAITTGFNNVALGYQALSLSTSSSNNHALGVQALRSTTTGSGNVAIGYNAMLSNTTGAGNIAIGSQALTQSVGVSNNVAIGFQSYLVATAPTNCTGVGFQAGYSSINPANNTLVGFQAGWSNVAGGNLTAVGSLALYNATGANNTGVGYQAGGVISTGVSNTAVGSIALQGLTTASNCTAIGFSALSANVSFANCTGVGANTAVTAANQVQLGDSTTTTYCYGTVQNRSDARDKADIRDSELGLDFIMKLRPVDYRYDMREDYRAKLSEDATQEELEAWVEKNRLGAIEHDGTHKRSRFHHGFIAQEVRDTGDNFGGFQDHAHGGGDEVMSLGYSEFIGPMVKAIQELKAIVEAQAATIATLQGAAKKKG